MSWNDALSNDVRRQAAITSWLNARENLESGSSRLRRKRRRGLSAHDRRQDSEKSCRATKNVVPEKFNPWVAIEERPAKAQRRAMAGTELFF